MDSTVLFAGIAALIAIAEGAFIVRRLLTRSVDPRLALLESEVAQARQQIQRQVEPVRERIGT